MSLCVRSSFVRRLSLLLLPLMHAAFCLAAAAASAAVVVVAVVLLLLLLLLLMLLLLDFPPVTRLRRAKRSGAGYNPSLATIITRAPVSPRNSAEPKRGRW